jgi:hypothetical protein
VLYFQNHHFVVGHAVGREAPSDMVTIDLERHAIDHCPALGGNLIPSTPSGCFSDVTVALNLIPGFIKEVMDSHLTLVIWEARGKLIQIGPGNTEGAVKGV